MPVASMLKTYTKPKTYEGKRKLLPIPSSEATRAFDALFAKNISLRNTSLSDSYVPPKQKKQKNKNNIKELPKQPSVFTDSFDVKIHSTFDELFAGPKYNSVRYTNHFSKVLSDRSYNTSNSKMERSLRNRTNKSKEDVKEDYKLKRKAEGKVQKREKNAKKKLINSFVNTVNNREKTNVKKKKENDTKLRKSTRKKSETTENSPKYKYLEESIDESLIIEAINTKKKPVKRFTSSKTKLNGAISKSKTDRLRRERKKSLRKIHNASSTKKNRKKLMSRNNSFQEKSINISKVRHINNSLINLSDNLSEYKFHLDSKNCASNSSNFPTDVSFNKFSKFTKCSTPIGKKTSINNLVVNISPISAYNRANIDNNSLSLFTDESVQTKHSYSNLRRNLLVNHFVSNNAITINESSFEISAVKSDQKLKLKPVVVLENLNILPKTNKLIPIVTLERLPYIYSGIIDATPDVSKVCIKRRRIKICDDVQIINNTNNSGNFDPKPIINVDLEKFESFVERNSYILCDDNSDVKFVSEEKLNTKIINDKTEIKNKRITVLPGKQYRRSLLNLTRDASIIEILKKSPIRRGRKCKTSVYQSENFKYYVEPKRSTLYNVQNRPNYRQSIKIVKFTNEENRITINRKKTGYVSTIADETVLEDFSKLSLVVDEERDKTGKEIVLKYCNQTEPLLFDECYSERSLTKCRKIGEGVYGEVFMYKNSQDKCVVMKIIPIEGEQLVNGEHQKKYEEIISEIIISTELSNLRTNVNYRSDGFAEVLNVSLVQGKYPRNLIDLWDLYDEDRGSENDSPVLFNDDQLYIVLELANGGQDLEAYNFNNAEMAYSLFIQIACTMAVAEAALQFEHRDLHWGNVLISPTDKPTSTFCLNGREFEIPTKGIKLTIIDFTLSRMTSELCCIYNDLAMDPDLFTAVGDYQFEVYRLMQKRVDDDWQTFEPYTNVLWLDYILDKMIGHLRYVRVNSKTHKNNIRKLSHIKKKVLNYNSVIEFINSDVFSNVFL